MKKLGRVSLNTLGALCAGFVLVLLSGGRPLLAHVLGQCLKAPIRASAPSIDGTIEPSPWGSPAYTIPLVSVSCADPVQRFYAMRTSALGPIYVAIDVPESAVDNSADTILLFIDGNHTGGGAPDTSDRAVRLLGFPVGVTPQTPTTAEIYTGNGAGWSAPAPFPTGKVKSLRTGSGNNTRLAVEMELPPSSTPEVGFAVVYLSGDLQDCTGDSISDNVLWPPALPFPTGAPPGLSNPSQWGDLRQDCSPVVEFNSPTCCYSGDISFKQSGILFKQPFTAGSPVTDITAQVHNRDGSLTANNAKVEIQVHGFGMGSPLFLASPTIPSISPSSSAPTSPATWASPISGHGCFRAVIQPPASPNDYTIGANSTAQYNVDVACLKNGDKKRMMFKMFNPDEAKEQKMLLVKRERIPQGMKGLAFELVQPDRPIRPKEEFEAAVAITAAAELPITDVPRQRVHVPPAAGGAVRPPVEGAAAGAAGGGGLDAVRITVKPGDRLHVMASGMVDLDGGGPVASAGPEGRDVSKEIPEGRFLLAGETARQFGGALIGSFDGFTTGFVLGPETTFTVPEKAEALWLAVNDVVGRHADNTGEGFDVEASTLPAPGKQGGPLAEVDVFAATTEEIKLGEHTYNVGRILGGVTYQVLVTGADTTPTPPPGGPSGKLWLLLLLILVVLILALRRKGAKP